MNPLKCRPTLLILIMTWYSCCPDSLAMLSKTNTSTAPSYENMTNYMENLVNQVYEGYPKCNNLTGNYPSPKGTRVIAHPNMDVWSLETDVTIWITVEGIRHLDVENQYLVLVVEETFFWTDEHFMDDSAAETDYVDIHKSKIWTPEILPDGIHDTLTLSESPTVRVHLNTGVCFQTRQKFYTIPCTVDVQPFPFDVHDCSLRLYQKQRLHTRMKLISHINDESRKHEDDPMVLITSNSDTKRLSTESGTLEWVIRDFNSTVVTRVRSNNDPFETDEYVLQLFIHRRSVFYATVIIFPCMLLNLLSFVIFTLPLKDTERENFAVTLILTYFVLIMIVVDASPSSGSAIPLLGLYIILSMCIVLVDFIVSLVLIEIHEHCRERDANMPKWLVKCLNSRCIVKAFTHERHFKQDSNGNNGTTEAETIMDTEEMLLQKKKETKKKRKRSIKETKNEYKWKVFLKVLNFTFFVLSIVAHIILALVMYLMLPKSTRAG